MHKYSMEDAMETENRKKRPIAECDAQHCPIGIGVVSTEWGLCGFYTSEEAVSGDGGEETYQLTGP